MKTITNVFFFSTFIMMCSLSYSQVNMNIEDLPDNDTPTMYISKNAYVYISGTGNLEIEEDVTNPTEGGTGNALGTGNLVIDSDSDEFGQIYVGGTYTGTPSSYAEYRRFTVSSATIRDLMSAPVSGQAFNEFQNGAHQTELPSGTIISGAKLFGPLDNMDENGDGQVYTEWLPTDTFPIEAGIGYRTGSSTAVGGNLIYRGDVETEDVEVNMRFGKHPRFKTNNLFGNPFTTYMDTKAFITAISDDLNAESGNNTGEFGIWSDFAYMYVFKQGTETIGSDGNTWLRIDSNNVDIESDGAGGFQCMGATAPENVVGEDCFPYIAPGQGFIMLARPFIRHANGDTQALGPGQSAGTITFKDSFRVVEVNHTDDFRAGAANDSSENGNSTNIIAERNSFRLNIQRGTINDQAIIYFYDGNTVNRGVNATWDVAQGASHSSGLLIGSHAVENSHGSNLVKQALSKDDLYAEDLLVPLHVQARRNIEHKISLQSLNIPSDADFYLIDTALDTSTLVSDGTEYAFTPSSNINGIGRFYLATKSTTLGVDDEELAGLGIISEPNKKITLKGFIKEDGILNVYDMHGRKVSSFNVEGNLNTQSFNVSNLSIGIYVAEIVTDSQYKTKKVAIR